MIIVSNAWSFESAITVDAGARARILQAQERKTVARVEVHPPAKCVQLRRRGKANHVLTCPAIMMSFSASRLSNPTIARRPGLVRRNR